MHHHKIAYGIWASMVALSGPASAAGLQAAMAPAPARLQVEVGTFSTVGPSTVAAGYQCTDQEGNVRRQNTPITFTPEFSAAPKVSVSLDQLDAWGATSIRVHAYAIGVTRSGATVVVETWCDTNLYAASGTITAVGSR